MNVLPTKSSLKIDKTGDAYPLFEDALDWLDGVLGNSDTIIIQFHATHKERGMGVAVYITVTANKGSNKYFIGALNLSYEDENSMEVMKSSGIFSDSDDSVSDLHSDFANLVGYYADSSNWTKES